MFFSWTYPRSCSPARKASRLFFELAAEPPWSIPIRGIFPGCASARRTEARAKADQQNDDGVPSHTGLFTAVHCRLSRAFFLAAQPRTPLSCQLNVTECQDKHRLRNYFIPD